MAAGKQSLEAAENIPLRAAVGSGTDETGKVDRLSGTHGTVVLRVTLTLQRLWFASVGAWYHINCQLGRPPHAPSPHRCGRGFQVEIRRISRGKSQELFFYKIKKS